MTTGLAAQRKVLKFDSTVSRVYVHRQSVAEVFLTDHLRLSEHEFAVGAQWPRAHELYRPTDGSYNILFYAETLRQAAIYLAHRCYDVPLDHCFVMSEIDVQGLPFGVRVDDHAAEVSVDVRMSGLHYRDGQLARFRIELEFRIGGSRIGFGNGAAQILPPEVYKRLRWRHRRPDDVGAPICGQPCAVPATAELLPSNVVLGPRIGPSEWELRVDDAHPVLFDHPSDHVPGALLLEAICQAGRVLTQNRATVVGLGATFRKYAELDRPVTVAACTDSSGKVSTARVVFRQESAEVAVGYVSFAESRT
ncbi:ScbA/BarX family gamma-butyrolactone biosynthesis protein [Nocardia sp. FBN12]|uniref:ScbA/BarX family gamma-butyrolactone biosynthesis protein n=1 Tax=Nocardia sp. FBN12 TaxID=3419766 RepID=UPI003CFFB47A